jgi:hypothetical protein
MKPQYELDFVHSDYHDSTFYLKSPSGKILWIHPSHARGQMREFYEELNETLSNLSQSS